jgi:hypothetical protein
MTEQDKQNRREDIKDAMKEAIHEWLDEKFSQFGKWSLATISALTLAAILWFVLTTHGWKPPQQ